ncbi:uncharacterized protein KGF55_002882 [Candida pseudojiufengensis]|uniref:uncharacterized protein n=1 Tax=Candida pseudojiufengensis TaxID=497109 RepID=UPI002224FCDB|nr:uncharacterized protein KGF55_002882 [Candida pseudojiufengensis]KAI5963090.1 hypothetical protein KGF55_002882 [Candida pseudojiufengensis]
MESVDQINSNEKSPILQPINNDNITPSLIDSSSTSKTSNSDSNNNNNNNNNVIQLPQTSSTQQISIQSQSQNQSAITSNSTSNSSLNLYHSNSNSNSRRHRLSVSHEDMNLDLVDPGTIRIDCSGAFIANDNLLRKSMKISNNNNEEEMNSSSSNSNTPTPPSSNTSSDLESDDNNDNDYDIMIDDLNDEEKLKNKNGLITKNNINLPKHNDEIIHISVDIGGTLTKLVYFSKLIKPLYKKNRIIEGGKLYFKDFQTENFKNEVMKFIIQLIKKSISKENKNPPITYIMATGGGANKFYNLMNKTFKKKNLPMKIIAKDEMECLIKGLDWLITKIPQEIFIYDLSQLCIKFQPLQNENEIYPYLLVNIGSGVSMIKVTKPGPLGFERIGGSSLGGGTLWGLLSLLTDAKDYNEMLEMAQRGDNENIDLLVGDIYGTNYNKIGLKANHIASSFAKVFKKLRFNNNDYKSSTNHQITHKPLLTSSEKLSQFKQEDIARSLLFSISNNIGQIAYLHALRFNLKRIYFGGSYISGHMQTIHTLSFAVNFWSKGDMESYFLRHEGYLGSVGAFMMGPATANN